LHGFFDGCRTANQAAAFFAKEERKSGKIAKAHKKRVQLFHGALANAGSIFVKK